MFNFFTISLISAIIFGLASIIVHFLRKDLSPVQHTLSRYAIGEKGWIITLGLLFMALSKLTLSIGIIKQDGISAGAFILGITSIGPFLAATFPAEITKSRSIKGYLHLAGALIEFLFFPFSVLLLGKTFENNNLASFSIFTGIATGIMFLIISSLFFLKHVKRKDYGYFGLIEKFNIFLILLWVILTSIVLNQS